MKINNAIKLLESKGFTLIERDTEEINKDQDIYDVQDYVLHHTKYKGLAQMQIIMDWLSFDNPDANSFINWIRNNYQSDTDFVDLCNKAVIAAEEHLYHMNNVPSQETFYTNEASQEYIDYASDQALQGNINVWDKAKIDKGQIPSWAKSVTNVGYKPKKLRQSRSASELAMQKVTNPNADYHYTENDLKSDNVNLIKQYKYIANTVGCDIEDEIKTDADQYGAYIYVNNFTFRIRLSNHKYTVTRINHDNVLDRKTDICRTFKDIVDFINNCI